MNKERFEYLKGIVELDYQKRHDTPQMYFTSDDLRWLVEQVEYWRINYYIKENLTNEAQELITLLYNNLGTSTDEDHALWMKTKEYVFKNKLISYDK